MPSVELAEYFNAERQGGFLLVALALAGVSLAAYLWLARSAFVAMAWPLVVPGALQLVVGLTVALRTPGQVSALESGFRAAPAVTASVEGRRIARVNQTFRVIKVVEVVVILAGLAMVLLFPHPGTWPAIGLGLIVEASALLAFDAFAHHRARVYAQWLQSLAA